MIDGPRACEALQTVGENPGAIGCKGTFHIDSVSTLLTILGPMKAKALVQEAVHNIGV
jgi:hypothetical protein